MLPRLWDMCQWFSRLRGASILWLVLMPLWSWLWCASEEHVVRERCKPVVVQKLLWPLLVLGRCRALQTDGRGGALLVLPAPPRIPLLGDLDAGCARHQGA